MKNWLSTFLLLSVFTVNAQEITDYEYIVIPESFSDFKTNEYGLKSYLNQQLKDKNYKLLSFNSDRWPDEIKQNPCLTIKADVKKGKSLLTNKLNITFNNCHQQIIADFEGISRIKEFDEGYKEAMTFAAQKIPASAPKNIVAIAPKAAAVNNNTSIKTEALIPTHNQFTNNTITVDKIDLKDGGFMLMNADNAQVIAKFYPSLKANVYHVLLTENNTSTIGYTNQNTISYEIPTANNTWKEVKFTSK